MKKPYWLVGDISGIKAASFEHEEALKNIGLHDGNFNGIVLAINNVRLFKSCCKCNRSIENLTLGSPCPNCQKELEMMVEDFSFTMNILNGDETVIALTGFKKIVNFEGPCTDENIVEGFLNSQLEGKSVEGDYIKHINYDIPAINNITFS